MWSRFLCQERLLKKFGNSKRVTQAWKTLGNAKYETWFHDERTRLHTAEVLLSILKTAMR